MAFDDKKFYKTLEKKIPFHWGKSSILYKIFGKGSWLWDDFTCPDQFGNDPYNPTPDTDISFIISTGHGRPLLFLNADTDVDSNWTISDREGSTLDESVQISDYEGLSNKIIELLNRLKPDWIGETINTFNTELEGIKKRAEDYLNFLGDWQSKYAKDRYLLNRISNNVKSAQKQIENYEKYKNFYNGVSDVKRIKSDRNVNYIARKPIKSEKYYGVLAPDGLLMLTREEYIEHFGHEPSEAEERSAFDDSVTSGCYGKKKKKKSVKSELDQQEFKEGLIRAGYTEEEAMSILEKAQANTDDAISASRKPIKCSSIKHRRVIKSGYRGSEFYLNTENLSGEELLTLDSILSGILNFNDKEFDVEKFFNDAVNYYVNAANYERPRYSHKYEDDHSWMYAMNKTIDREFGLLDNLEILDWKSSNFSRLSDEEKDVWNKAIEEVEKNSHNDYW